MPGNLLVKNNRLSGVIDFGCMGVGDPASDLITAWNLLPSQARQVFKQELNIDDATWARGRGWAFSMALVQLPYYEHTNPVLAANARYTINEILSSR
jgi:aminoglycoside phosphotransferase (APT) family kinase protein